MSDIKIDGEGMMKRSILAGCALVMALWGAAGLDGACADQNAKAGQSGNDDALKALRGADEKLRDDLAVRIKRHQSGALGDLATLYEQGDNAGPIDRAGALDLYERAADEGDPVGREKICLAYLLGQGRPKNAAKAMPYCNALGENHPVGLFSVGYDYQHGLSGPADEAMAMALYIKAVPLGSGDAAYALGEKALALGKPQAARIWFKQGVYLGSADAMDRLAAMIEAGDGGPLDELEAGWLYAHAAERGNAHAAGKVEAATNARPLTGIAFTNASGAATALVHTYSDNKGTHEEKIDMSVLVQTLTNHFPANALDADVEGRAMLECYIGADQALDVCVVRREFPLGYGFGPTIMAFFKGRVSVAPEDVAGQPTRNRLVKMLIRWQLK
jgi:TPR repeat protein